jgi:uncharacterized membrane protein YkvA (DUF1232 family)
MTELIQNARLAWRLFNDPRVPIWLKVAVPLVVALYFISPIDLIPDFLVGVGELDDLGVILLGLSLFVRLAPSYVVEEHRRELGLYGTAVNDGGYRPAPGAATRRPSGEPTRPIEGEYRVVPPDR